MTGILKKIFEQSFSHGDFIVRLDSAGFDFYIRGKSPGVVDKESGRKYRFQTLGLLEQLEALDDSVADKKDKAQKTKSDEKKQKVEQNPKMRDNTKQEIKDTGGQKMGSQNSKEEIAKKREDEMKSRRSKMNSDDSSDQNKQGN